MNEASMRTALLTDTTLAALIGTRLAPRTMPLGTATPYVTFFLISSPQTQQGIEQPVYQFNVVASDYTQVLSTANALVIALAKVVSAGVAFGAHAIGERSDYEDDTKLHIKNISIRFDAEKTPIFS